MILHDTRKVSLLFFQSSINGECVVEVQSHKVGRLEASWIKLGTECL